MSKGPGLQATSALAGALRRTRSRRNRVGSGSEPI